MNTNKPLYWHQGLFLQPNHFQYQDAYNEFIQSVIRRTVAPLAWGVASARVDTTGLDAGQIGFSQLRVLFQDGTLFSFPENARLAGRLFDGPVWEDRNKPLRIYLGVKKRNEEPFVQREISGASDSTVSSRFVIDSQSATLSNRYEQAERVEAQVLSLEGRLWFESELDQAVGYDLIPVAQLIRAGDQVKLDKHFIAPCITMRGDSNLVELLRSIREEVLSRTRQLEEYKQPATSYTVSEFNPRQMRYRLALQVMVRYVQSLTHILEIPDLPPERAYTCLRELTAELSVFTPLSSATCEIAPENIVLPAYNHLKLGDCFSVAHTLIHRLLNEITISSEAMVSFERLDNASFRGVLDGEMRERKGTYFLILRTVQSQDSWLEDFRRYSKLGAESQVAFYQARALPGIGKHLLNSRPEGLPSRPNSHYFSLDVASSLWHSVESDACLSLIWPGAPEDLKVELVSLRG